MVDRARFSSPIMKTLRESRSVDAAAELLALSPSRVRVAVRYYTAYDQEIRTEIAGADAASVAAEREWQAERRLLS